MLLNNKRALVYGAGGHVGGSVARALAHEGATVYLAGRTEGPLQAVAADVRSAGGHCEVMLVDALDRDAVESATARVATSGPLDISFNAISIRGDLQGTPLLEMNVEDYTAPIEVAARTHFITGTAAARRMVEQGSGVVVTLSSTAARLSGRDQRFHRTGGFGVACAAIEAFTRVLAAEVGPRGVRVVGVRSDALPETWGLAPGPDGRIAFDSHSVGSYMVGGTVLDRLPTLNELAATVAFVASDRASSMTGTVVNISVGSVLD